MKIFKALGLFVLTIATAAAPAAAQVRTVDPNSAIDADLNQPQSQSQWNQPAPPAEQSVAVDPGSQTGELPVDPAPTATAQPATTTATNAQTYEDQDVLSAAEGVFGKGAAGLAGMVEKLLKEQGRPNAYIAGREAGGALIIGVRYGSGILSHKVEGDRKVFWTGPSVGFDVGGDANKVFVLVYNLYDSQELYQRFPAVEGRAFFIGGFAATYLRRGDTVLIPIRLGVGWRLGANVGYMKFTEKSKWLPF